MEWARHMWAGSLVDGSTNTMVIFLQVELSFPKRNYTVHPGMVTFIGSSTVKSLVSEFLY